MAFSKILVANRGEIACRVIRTAQAMGYSAVAVFSDADRDAAHVQLADEAVHIGASPALQSYLNVAAILAAARKSGADALHPGYGFLSENAAFAQACLDAGLVFIGPPPAAMLAMGNKAQAKARMLAAGVPCAPGYLGQDQSEAALIAQAEQLGVPLLVKAVAGGGGRGMRQVSQLADLPAAIEGARREAINAFGDGTLMLERLIEHGRHIEVQVFADAHGHAVHLGERDCSTQRRRQKIMEEAPSPVLSPELRQALGQDAVAAALAVAYQGAGTVEFIVDAQMRHYFLEMNTRLQVEHPVTECVTGLDLVAWQLRVAAGEPLPARQADIRFTGHAIEVRLCAEDPYSGFAPQTGDVLWWKPDAVLPAGVRIDHGLREGEAISPFYDPMVAKLIAHGHDRSDALRRLRAALAQTPLLGLKNNGGFLRDLLDHPDCRNSALTTGTIDQWLAQGHPMLQAPPVSEQLWCWAAIARATQQGSSWRSSSVSAYGFALRCGHDSRAVRVQLDNSCGIAVTLDGHTHAAQVLSHTEGCLHLVWQGVQQKVLALTHGAQLHLAHQGHSFVFEEISAFPTQNPLQDKSRALAPVAGTVRQLRVAVGDAVQAEQALICVEAMKMEMWVCAQSPGTVKAVHAQPGQQVALGELLLELQA
jgi:geranyl-CoA carboxylase alpha subunit